MKTRTLFQMCFTLTLCFLGSQSVFAQAPSTTTPASDTTKYLVVKNDGNEYVGLILSDDGREVLIQTTSLGKIYIPKSDIKSIRPIDLVDDVKKGELISSHQIFDSSFNSNFEFSPNEKYFYCRLNYFGFMQYEFADLLVKDSIYEVSGRKILNGNFGGDIQLGINGKIYLTKTRDYFIGCIAYPNEKCESIEFTDTAIKLSLADDYLSSNTFYNALSQSRPDLNSNISHGLSNNPVTPCFRFDIASEE